MPWWCINEMGYDGRALANRWDHTVSDFKPDTPETLALMDRAQTGDTVAIGELLRRHREGVRSYVERRMDVRIGARADASDVMQEAGLEVTRRLQEYLEQRPMPFRVWLARTARENYLRLRRHATAARRSVGREEMLPEQSSVLIAHQLGSPGGTPSQAVANAELAARVRVALTRLDETDREILMLRAFEGLTNAEVAQVLDLEVSAASKRYARALFKLKRALAAGGVTEG